MSRPPVSASSRRVAVSPWVTAQPLPGERSTTMEKEPRGRYFSNENPENMEKKKNKREHRDVYQYEELVMDEHSKMFLDLKHIIVGEYFSGESLNRHGHTFEWHDEDGFTFSKRDPLVTFLEQDHVRVKQVKNPGRADVCTKDVDLLTTAPSCSSRKTF